VDRLGRQHKRICLFAPSSKKSSRTSFRVASRRIKSEVAIVFARLSSSAARTTHHNQKTQDNTRTHAHTHTQKHICTHARMHRYTHTHYTHAHSHYTHSLIHSLRHTDTDTDTNTDTDTDTDTDVDTDTDADSDTHTHTWGTRHNKRKATVAALTFCNKVVQHLQRLIRLQCVCHLQHLRRMVKGKRNLKLHLCALRNSTVPGFSCAKVLEKRKENP